MSFRKVVRAARIAHDQKEYGKMPAGFDFMAHVDAQLAELAKADGYQGYYMAIWHPLHDPLARKELVADARDGVMVVTSTADVAELAEGIQDRSRYHRDDLDLEDLRVMAMPEGCRTKVYTVRRSITGSAQRFIDLFCLPGTRVRILYWGLHNGRKVSAMPVMRELDGRWSR